MVTPVTVQTVSTAADLLLIATAGGLLVLFFTVMVQALRRGRRDRAGGRPRAAGVAPARQQVNVELAFLRTRNLRRTRLVVVEGSEGSFPGPLEIGGEGSPFHARAGWSI